MRAMMTVLVLAVIALASCGCSGHSGKDSELKGSGSTFVAPLMEKWIEVYANRIGSPFHYTANGSGAGIFQLIGQKVDFACGDAPFDEQELQNARATGSEVVHIPLILGAVVPVYNLDEKGAPLRLTGPLLADIFLGKIKKWNDPRLKAVQERAMHLADQEITVVHRADGSGTTDIFTDYLSKVSSEWREKVGHATAVKWPAGIGEDGNNGVAAHVKRTPGAIGYVGLDHAMNDELQFAAVQNRDGEFIQATLPSVEAAANAMASQLPDDLRYSLTDVAGKGVYPISGTTWGIVYAKPPKHGQATVDFFRWIIHDGQPYAAQLYFIALPAPLVERAEKKLTQIQVGK